ncbi:PA domain-containing protein, partial [Klebsiella pneumoniae]|uniref:PA domain-containing protein n=1 Tax=Klebsiella pneumoniae TaxID=573 RepID=UPI00396838F6
MIQRGTCNFEQKAENAAAAGAAGVIIFNQGNTDDRKGLANVTGGETYTCGMPALYDTDLSG